MEVKYIATKLHVTPEKNR